MADNAVKRDRCQEKNIYVGIFERGMVQRPIIRFVVESVRVLLRHRPFLCTPASGYPISEALLHVAR